MEFILDTNAYRNLIEGLTLSEVHQLAEKMRTAEDNKGHTAGLSIVVSMELIKHLGKDDPAKERCYKALCLQWLHTRRFDFNRGNITGTFYPPMNVILAQHFFDNNSKYLALYMKVLELIVELTQNLNINNCMNHEVNIKIVKNQVDFETTEFKNNVEEFLKFLNGGELDWKFIRNNKEELKEFTIRINDGRIETLLGIGLLKRAHQVMDKEAFEGEATKRFDGFLSQYKAALVMNTTLMQSIAGGSEKLADIEDSKWNTLNDVQIMFGLLYSKDGLDKRLVTEEKRIGNSANKAGVGHLIMTLSDYKAAIGI
jgi:hypothetical protein